MKRINYLCFVFLFCLGSCNKYNDLDALRELSKANDLKPKVTADFVSTHFPCKTKTDTIVSTHTDYQYIDVICPTSDSTSDTIYIDKIKVVNKSSVIKKTIALPSKTITIVKYFEDFAKIQSLTIANSQTQAELKKCGDKKDKASSLNLWLIICLCFSIIVNLIQFRK